MNDEDSALRMRGSPSKSPKYSDDIEDLDSGKPSGYHSKKKANLYPDPIADQLLQIYQSLNLQEYENLKFAFLAIPIFLIVFFYVFISSSTSSLISFTAWNFSILFIIISIWILCEILNKDTGPKAMQDIAEVIREGSEGFFITQYGTIFKYAFLTSIGLFFLYAFREIPAKSALSEYFSSVSMAFMTSLSFLLGSVCSAISGYAGIWVSVRANLRVAAAAKKCYNDAI